ncbi:MAG: NitT/TauT family transport system ATP-binding protein [Paracoccaceae bacterium]
MRTIPTALMADAVAVAVGEIGAFCVGAPLGAATVDQSAGDQGAGDNPDQVHALMRAVWRATRWLANPSARITVSPDGHEETPPGFLEFFDGATNFPWRSQAMWITGRMGLDATEAMATARACFRGDLYRHNLGPVGASWGQLGPICRVPLRRLKGTDPPHAGRVLHQRDVSGP